VTGINYQNKQCFITLHEILATGKKEKIVDKIKSQLPSFLQSTIPKDFEDHLGHQISISTTPEEYESTDIKIGQVVKVDMPTKLADIILIEKPYEKSEIKLE